MRFVWSMDWCDSFGVGFAKTLAVVAKSCDIWCIKWMLVISFDQFRDFVFLLGKLIESIEYYAFYIADCVI